jgi:RHS repeat-associated protein
LFVLSKKVQFRTALFVSIHFGMTMCNQRYGVETGVLYIDAGRLQQIKHYDPRFPRPIEYCSYTYNDNSQVENQLLNSGNFSVSYSYNNRNWLDSVNAGNGVMNYFLSFYANGNVDTQSISGTYKGAGNDIVYNYLYDKSNRLLSSVNTAGPVNAYKVLNTYDGDGNILTMKRYNENGSLSDDFNYSYASGTNKLNLVSGDEAQYTYDNNGNLTMDIMNYNGSMVYDYRNLLIGSQNTISPNVNFFTKYYYDEAGNRIRQWTYHSTNGGGGSDKGESWGVSTDNDEYYVRDITGKEIAIYNGSTLIQWNVYGMDNVGKINNDRTRNFYIKDHLGNIRAVTDESNGIVSYADYDPWGNYLRGGGGRYGFTSKEKDKDFVNNYNYFGARYYDARIGRWGGVEPLFNKYPSFTPYFYSSDNPVNRTDNNGADDYYYMSGERVPIKYSWPGNNRYFIQHLEGDWMINGDPSGNRFFECNSQATMQVYLQNSGVYNSSDVVTNFETQSFVGYYEAAKPASTETRSSFAYAYEESPNTSISGKMDQKRNLSAAKLYVFEGKILNNEEAGNVIWGAVMYYLGFSMIESKLDADIAKRVQATCDPYPGDYPLRPDQINEQNAIEMGWEKVSREQYIRRWSNSGPIFKTFPGAY